MVPPWPSRPERRQTAMTFGIRVHRTTPLRCLLPNNRLPVGFVGGCDHETERKPKTEEHIDSLQTLSSWPTTRRVATMKQKPNAYTRGKKSRPKAKLGIPDLEMSKAAVLRSLGSPDSRRGYQHAIDEFVAWYCSEPRLALNKTVVLRYRINLQERGLAPGTINVRMAAVRRLAYEAADCGLLSPELAAASTASKEFANLDLDWATG